MDECLLSLDSFRAPIYVKATDKSTVVTTLDTNGDSPITIRNPEEMSSYASNVMRLAINHCKSSEPAVADRRPEIVIAHGTYTPPSPQASPRTDWSQLASSTTGTSIGPYSHFLLGIFRLHRLPHPTRCPSVAFILIRHCVKYNCW